MTHLYSSYYLVQHLALAVLKVEASAYKTIIWTYKKLCIHRPVIFLRISAQITDEFTTIIKASLHTRIVVYASIHG